MLLIQSSIPGGCTLHAAGSMWTMILAERRPGAVALSLTWPTTPAAVAAAVGRSTASARPRNVERLAAVKEPRSCGSPLPTR